MFNYNWVWALSIALKIRVSIAKVILARLTIQPPRKISVCFPFFFCRLAVEKTNKQTNYFLLSKTRNNRVLSKWTRRFAQSRDHRHHFATDRAWRLVWRLGFARGKAQLHSDMWFPNNFCFRFVFFFLSCIVRARALPQAKDVLNSLIFHVVGANVRSANLCFNFIFILIVFFWQFSLRVWM